MQRLNYIIEFSAFEQKIFLHSTVCISLWRSDAVWWHWFGSTLLQVMACYLTAQSHCLNKCWLITSKVHCHSSEGNFTNHSSAINHWHSLKITYPQFRSNLPGCNELKLGITPKDCRILKTFIIYVVDADASIYTISFLTWYKKNPQITIKRARFTHWRRVSFAWFTFCCWHHNWLLMATWIHNVTSQFWR